MVRGGAALALLHAMPARAAADQAEKHLYLPARARYRRGSMSSTHSKLSKVSKGSSKGSGQRTTLAMPPRLGDLDVGEGTAKGGSYVGSPSHHEAMLSTVRTPRARG